jgi:sugar/nucleoside kinase (ribokinase family)
MYAHDGACLQVAPPRVDAVDSTGSGDAFDAGFIHALLDGAGMQDRVRCACICGALSTRAPGAITGLPDVAELRDTYEQTYGS